MVDNYSIARTVISKFGKYYLPKFVVSLFAKVLSLQIFVLYGTISPKIGFVALVGVKNMH